MLWTALRGAPFAPVSFVRISGHHPAAIPPAKPTHRPGDRSPPQNRARRTYAQYLQSLNAHAGSPRRDCSAGPIPFADHLRRGNDQIDLANRLAAPPSHTRPNAPHKSDPNGSGPNSAGLNGLAPMPQPLTPASPGPWLPRLGGVPPPTETTRQVEIHVAYGVRNLLSRGAIIDLMG